MSGSLPVYNPPQQQNPLVTLGQMAGGVTQLRDFQAKQATADAYQASIDPNTGAFDQGKFNALIGSTPQGAWNAGPTMQQSGQAQYAEGAGQTAQINAKIAQLQGISGYMTPLFQQTLGPNPTPVTGQQVLDATNQAAAAGLATPEMVANVRKQVASLGPNGDATNLVRGAMFATQTGTEQLRALAPPSQPVNLGGSVGFVQTSPLGVGYNAPPGTNIGTTLTPEGVMAAGIVYPATADDVKAGRASAVGADVHVSGADVIARFGLNGMLPPGARVDTAGPGGGRGGGVVGADGKLVGPANPPRLLKVPAQPGSAAPAPPGTSEAPPLPTPPVPPAGAAPTAPSVGAAPVVSTSPTLRGPGSPVPPAPLAPQPGQVWNPNNPVGTSTVPPRAQAPTGGPRSASLQGGTQVASANALAPNVGAPSAPSPLVPSDVNAIMAGINRTQGTPTQGTQVASTFSVGPGTEQVQSYKTSADKLAADNVAAANFQNTQFPYIQALKTYGEGTTTGPTTDFWNQVAGTIRTPLAKLGVDVSALNDNTQRQDALGKWLANIQSGNPLSGRSDAELAQVLKGSASTHINETTGADMVKAGLSLQRMSVAANREWNNNPALQQQYGTYLNYLANYNSTIDPRAFAVDMYNPQQIARLRSQLQKGSEADAQRFEASLALARRNGMIGGAGSQAMP
jgi:hypothetical protein